MEFDSCGIVYGSLGATYLLAARAIGPWSVPLLLLALTLPILTILLRAYRYLRETTLIVPLVWTAASFCGVVWMTMWAGTMGDRPAASAFAAWQFVIACGTLCPLVAVIGAKRPQHGAWNLVVLTLWGLLSLPAAEVLFLQPGQSLEINSFRSWFLVVLLVAELVNFGFTRFGAAAFLLVAAQVVWLLPYLPLVPLDWTAVSYHVSRQFVGFGLLTVALIFSWWSAHAERRDVSTLDRLWFDFRDSFGLFWALRLMERVNDTAQQAGWDFDLGWTGFRTKSDFAPLGKLPREIAGPLRNSLQGLLRRFVSNAWIAARLDPGTMDQAKVDCDTLPGESP